jgi:prevent-host-death family protein
MININEGIRSMTEFKQNSTEILNYIKKTHTPTILTVNGRAEAVLLDAKHYQEMVDKIEMIDSARQLEEALIDLKKNRDKCIPAKKVFRDLKKKISKR